MKSASKIYVVLLVWVVITLALVSCKTVKKTTLQDIKTEKIEKESITKVTTDDIRQELTGGGWINSLTQSSKESWIVVYDTSAPVDTLTGRHPVLAEISTKSEERQEMQAGDSVEWISVEQLYDSAYLTSNVQLTRSAKVAESFKSTPLSASIKFVLFLLLIIIVLASYHYWFPKFK